MENYEKLEILHGLCGIVMDKLEECKDNLSRTKDMSVSDIEIVDKLSHSLKCIKATIAMIEAEEEETEGASGRSYRRSRNGGSYDGSYEGGTSGRRNRMGRYSREGGYSGHDGMEDILMDVREMPESERRKLKAALERM